MQETPMQKAVTLKIELPKIPDIELVADRKSVV